VHGTADYCPRILKFDHEIVGKAHANNLRWNNRFLSQRCSIDEEKIGPVAGRKITFMVIDRGMLGSPHSEY